MWKLALCLCLLFTGCASKGIDEGGNPINRSLLIDQNFGFGFEIPGVPLPIPKLNLNFGLHFRRLSPQEEIDLELAKNGKFRQITPIDLPKTGPTPPISGAK